MGFYCFGLLHILGSMEFELDCCSRIIVGCCTGLFVGIVVVCGDRESRHGLA